MQLIIPAPLEVEYQRDPTCGKCIADHCGEGCVFHAYSHTVITFDIPRDYSPEPGAESMRLAREYIFKPHELQLVPDEFGGECLEALPRLKVEQNFPFRIFSTEQSKRPGNTFSFFNLPVEIRDIIYLLVLESSEEHWAVMTAWIPVYESDDPVPYTILKYNFGSKQLQLTCRQIRQEVFQVIQSYPQHIYLCELGVANFDTVLDIFRSQRGLRRSARHITLYYSTPILGATPNDKYSYLSLITDSFLSLVRLCPNVKSLFISLVTIKPCGNPSKFCLYIPCQDRTENVGYEIAEEWHAAARWEVVVDMEFRSLRQMIQLGLATVAAWEYTCGCYAIGEIEVVVPEKKLARPQIGARAADLLHIYGGVQMRVLNRGAAEEGSRRKTDF